MSGENKLNSKSRVNQKSDVAASNEEAPTHSTVVSDGSKHKFGNKKLAIIVGIPLIVVAVICAVFITHTAHQNKISKQRSALVAQAAPLLTPDNTTQLATVIAKIKQEPGYAQDANCLYVLTMYYINAQDAANTKTYYSMLVKNYDAKKGYSDASLKSAQSPSQLSSWVSFTENQAANAKQDFFAFPAEPAP